MALIITDNQHYSNIASAIRTKLSTNETFTPAEMAGAIMSISTGEPPTGTITLSSNTTYDVTNYASAIVNVPDPDYMMKYNNPNALTSYTNSVTTTISYGVFAYTPSLTSVAFPQATVIDQYAFAYCFKLASLSFPEVSSIKSYAFQYCSSLTFKLSSGIFPKLSGTLGNYAFRGCQYLNGIDLSGLTSIGTQAFSACSRIKTVNLPEVTFLAAGCFSYLTTCSEYSLPKVKTVGQSAFYSNWALTTLTLPAATTISAYAFRYCSALMSIYFTGSTVPTLASTTVFANMPMSVSVNNVYGSIYVPSSLYNTYYAATYWSVYKNRLVSIT